LTAVLETILANMHFAYAHVVRTRRLSSSDGRKYPALWAVHAVDQLANQQRTRRLPAFIGFQHPVLAFAVESRALPRPRLGISPTIHHGLSFRALPLVVLLELILSANFVGRTRPIDVSPEQKRRVRHGG